MTHVPEPPTNPHFVWVRNPAGPEPQKWGELNYGVNHHMQKSGYVLKVYPLSQAAWNLSIDDLAKLYPAP